MAQRASQKPSCRHAKYKTTFAPMPGARRTNTEAARFSIRLLLTLAVAAAVAIQAGCGGQSRVASTPKARHLYLRLEALPPDTAARQATVLNRVAEIPSPAALVALARGRRTVAAFSALTPGTVILRWRVGARGGRIVAESRRHFDKPLRGARARLTVSATPGAQPWLARLGSRLSKSPVAAFVEYRPAHGQAEFCELRTEGPRRADNSNVETIAGASADRRLGRGPSRLRIAA